MLGYHNLLISKTIKTLKLKDTDFIEYAPFPVFETGNNELDSMYIPTYPLLHLKPIGYIYIYIYDPNTQKAMTTTKLPLEG